MSCFFSLLFWALIFSKWLPHSIFISVNTETMHRISVLKEKKQLMKIWILKSNGCKVSWQREKSRICQTDLWCGESWRGSKVLRARTHLIVIYEPGHYIISSFYGASWIMRIGRCLLESYSDRCRTRRVLLMSRSRQNDSITSHLKGTEAAFRSPQLKVARVSLMEYTSNTADDVWPFLNRKVQILLLL